MEETSLGFGSLSDLPKQVRRDDPGRREPYTEANNLKMAKLVWIGQVAHVPGQNVFHAMNRG